MNKTISINLGGLFYHIDESAYSILKNYLESISQSLNDEPQGKKEILEDIEARISELLSEKIRDNRQVVNEEDIQNIINIMGQPEDYVEVNDSYTDTSDTKTNKSNNSTNTTKRLYRDKEDRFMGGIASGIAHYFSTDPIWIRIAFILASTIGFGVGTYIILWILIPEAKTTAQKLQMHGEPVNIDNIEKKIRDEFDNISDKIKNADYNNLKTFLQDFLELLGSIAIKIFNVLGKIIGLTFIIGSCALFILFVNFCLSFDTFDIFNTYYIPFIDTSIFPYQLLLVCLFIAITVPLIMLFYLGAKMISPTLKKMNKVVFFTLVAIWIMSLSPLIFTKFQFYSKNAYTGHHVYNTSINNTATDSLYLSIVNNDDLHFRNYLKRSSEQVVITENDFEKIYTNNIYINIKNSKTEETYVKVVKKSEGSNQDLANQNADTLEYSYEINDNKIKLDGYFLSPINNLFKKESVSITLYIANHTTLYFDESVSSFLRKYKTTKKIKRWKLMDHYLIMTKKGLKCTDCEYQDY